MKPGTTNLFTLARLSPTVISGNSDWLSIPTFRAGRSTAQLFPGHPVFQQPRDFVPFTRARSTDLALAASCREPGTPVPVAGRIWLPRLWR